MTELSTTAQDASLSRAGVLRERLRSTKQSAVGQAMGKSDSWASKVLEGSMGVTLDDIPALLAALNLKVVDVNDCTVNRDVFESYRKIAALALTEPDSLLLKA